MRGGLAGRAQALDAVAGPAGPLRLPRTAARDRPAIHAGVAQGLSVARDLRSTIGPYARGKIGPARRCPYRPSRAPPRPITTQARRTTTAGPCHRPTPSPPPT